MEENPDLSYQEGGIRHPDATVVDIIKKEKGIKEITKITGWWNDQGVVGLEVEHGAGGVVAKGVCEEAKKMEPPHCASLRLSDGECFKEIVGQLAGKIERLTFRTSRGTTITFGCDKPGGTLFKLAMKNHKIGALSIGVGKQMYFIGSYFAPIAVQSPIIGPMPSEDQKEPEEFKLEYTKAITYTCPKAIGPGADIKALDDPETYGKFDDFEWAIKNPINEGKAVSVKEVMLYFSNVKRTVLGYRMRYEIRDPTKPSGKIVELKHVAPNPLTPTLHSLRVFDEGERIVSVKGKSKKSVGEIYYLAFVTSLGTLIEAGVKDDIAGDTEDFTLEGKGDEKTIIAFAGKVTHSLNALGIYCTK